MTKTIEIQIPDGYVLDNADYSDGKVSLKLKEKPIIKAGDIVVFESLDYKEIIIVGKVIYGSFFNPLVSTATRVYIEECCSDFYRQANEEERAEMMQYLADNNLKWDEEKNTIEKIRWRAIYNDKYWLVDSRGRIECIEEEYDHIDSDRYYMGNYFRTKEEAKASKFYKVFHE